MKPCGFWMRPRFRPASSEYKENRLRAVWKKFAWNEALNMWIMTSSPLLRERIRPNYSKTSNIRPIFSHNCGVLACRSTAAFSCVNTAQIYLRVMNGLWFNKHNFLIIFKIFRHSYYFDVGGLFGQQYGINIYLYLCTCAMHPCICTSLCLYLFLHRCSRRKIINYKNNSGKVNIDTGGRRQKAECFQVCQVKVKLTPWCKFWWI